MGAELQTQLSAWPLFILVPHHGERTGALSSGQLARLQIGNKSEGKNNPCCGKLCSFLTEAEPRRQNSFEIPTLHVVLPLNKTSKYYNANNDNSNKLVLTYDQGRYIKPPWRGLWRLAPFLNSIPIWASHVVTTSRNHLPHETHRGGTVFSETPARHM